MGGPTLNVRMRLASLWYRMRFRLESCHHPLRAFLIELPAPSSHTSPFLTFPPPPPPARAAQVEPDGGYNELGAMSVDFYNPTVIGQRIQALGCWERRPSSRNANFVPCAIDGFDTEDHDPEAKFRRVDFTVLCLT